MAKVWLIRNDTFSNELEEGGFISIGWDGTADLDAISLEIDSLVADLAQLNPDSSMGSLRTWAYTLNRFYDELTKGDIVVAPYDESKFLRIGHVVGDYYYVSDASTHRHRVPVRWTVTDFPKDALSEYVQEGLRNIGTLSRVRREPDLFEQLASDPAKVRQLREANQTPSRNGHNAQKNTWLVGATIDNKDKTQECVKGGYWKLSDGLSGAACDMQVGDNIAIKSSFIQKNDLPFENHGIPVSTMNIKARGTIRAVEEDRILVDWDPEYSSRIWYFFTSRRSVWRLSPKNRWSPYLEQFIFEDEDQDYEVFLASDFWRRYRDEGERLARQTPTGTISYRKASPSADPIYDAAAAWKSALIQGNSLFSGEPLDYREATDGFIDYFVNRPDQGDGTFLGKLRVQLEPAPTSTVQLAAELMFLYTMPLQPSSMKPETKLSHINEILSWRNDATIMSSKTQETLSNGIIRVGTAFHTYRWAIFQYLGHLVHKLSQQTRQERADVLTDWDSFQELLNGIDVQASQSMRLILEHLLFPARALLNASTADRQRMSKSFMDFLGENGDPNDLIHYLQPNVRYGDRLELNVYAAPHKYTWMETADSLRIWASWASLVLEGSELVVDDRTSSKPLTLSQSSLALVMVPLRELQTDSAHAILQWMHSDEAESLRSITKLMYMETAAAIDVLHGYADFTGSSAEFLEAATGVLHEIDPNIPRYYQASVPTLLSELSSLFVNPNASPGELFMSMQEALDSLRWGLFFRDGIELNTAILAELAQEIISLDAQETDWKHAVKTAFQDWRAGRLDVSPDDIANEHMIVEETEQTRPHQERTQHIPASLEELAQKLTFMTEESLEWLRITRTLLHQKRQLIFQGPPGTGKTFIARALAEFLTQDPNRVTLVQFHPATTYEDFVQGLRPEEGKAGAFTLRNGPLLQAAERARQEPDANHVIIIDEINRANLPAVFGELYYLLEYRDQDVTLNYGDTFRLPENLLVIGTMNTADRSIAAIDSALRRRFFIRDLRPEEQPLVDVLKHHVQRYAPDLDWLTTLLERANELINDPDQSIGPSHFLLGSKLTEEAAHQAWAYTVMPTLREYFYGQKDRTSVLSFDQLKAHALTGDVDAAAD